MARSKGSTQRGSLRIIGGDWRGRRLTIPETTRLRPTPDRVRETLFNWIAPVLPGSRCLDAFAGTGALGLEALSRGADTVIFVEREQLLASAIEAALGHLGVTGGTLVRGGSPDVLPTLDGDLDVVFVDPPFDTDLIPATLAALVPLLARNHRVYLEFSAAEPPTMPEGWRILRDKTAGDVGYQLVRFDPTP